MTKNSFCACPASVAVLRAAQAFGFLRRIDQRLRPIGKAQPFERGFEHRAVIRRAAGDDAAFAFHHHRARFGKRGRHQRNAGLGTAFGNGAHPFGTAAGLAETAPGQNQPDSPIAGRRQLFVTRHHSPVIGPFILLVLIHGSRDLRRCIHIIIGQPIEAIAVHSPCALRALSCASRWRIASTLRSIDARTSAALTLRCWAWACAAFSRWAESSRSALAKS